jgi:hypothetical protein
MLHRIATRLATLLLVAGLLAVPATAGAKSHHKRHARHHLVNRSAGAQSVGRSDAPAPTGPAPTEPAPTEPAPAPAPPAPSADAGTVASFTDGVLDVALTAGGDVTGKVIPGGTQFSCRSASTGLPVTDGCNASLLQPGASLHEFSVNYASGGAWLQRIIVVLP